MPLSFACPHCGLQTLVDDEFAGMSGPCAGCGKTVAVPFFQPSATDAAAKPATNRRQITLIVILGILAAGGVFAVLFTFVFPSMQYVGNMLHSAQCRTNLRQIAAALKQYEVEHGSLPPAYIADSSGKPLHSWRVLILPQLGEHGLYARYNFNEPWNGPNNSQLWSSMPDVYACPADPDARNKGETSYMVIVGPKTLFPGSNVFRLGGMSDEPSSTILVAETPTNGVTWLQPKDLDATRMLFGINGSFSGEVGSFHQEGAHVATVDGNVYFLDDQFPSDYAQGMSTPSGDEYIPGEVLH